MMFGYNKFTDHLMRVLYKYCILLVSAELMIHEPDSK